MKTILDGHRNFDAAKHDDLLSMPAKDKLLIPALIKDLNLGLGWGLHRPDFGSEEDYANGIDVWLVKGNQKIPVGDRLQEVDNGSWESFTPRLAEISKLKRGEIRSRYIIQGYVTSFESGILINAAWMETEDFAEYIKQFENSCVIRQHPVNHVPYRVCWWYQCMKHYKVHVIGDTLTL